mmetsp:Transcript_25686/g.54256  ORF Transcript_25686/g.54256 Transcript_25686/m.54256 type:complete len:631 (+) Transcript_25686:118-2010(+)
MNYYTCHVQARARKKCRRPSRRPISIVTTLLWHQLLSMKSVSAACPIVASRSQLSKGLLRSGGLAECRRAVGGLYLAPALFVTQAKLLHYTSTSRCVPCSFAAQKIRAPNRNLPMASMTGRCELKFNKKHFSYSSRSFSTRLFLHQGDTEINERNWKSFSDELNETLEVPSISVPAQHVHSLLSNKNSPLTPFLATRMIELEGIHPRIKLVRDCDGEPDEELHDGDQKPQRRKRILLDLHLSSGVNTNEHNEMGHSSQGHLFELKQQFPGIPEKILQQLVEDFKGRCGEPESIDILYQNQPVNRILTKLLPPEAQPPPSSYEQVGHVAHVNLRQPHVPYGKLIGQVMLDRLQSSIRTVVNKLGEVGGPYRTYQMDLLAGDDDYFVHQVEHGVSLYFDLKRVYWCTRLEGERTYMIENDFKPNQTVADAFCGVGALCIRAATAKGCRILANDLNPDAVAYCKDSASRNGIDVGPNGKFHVQCGDASQFIMNLGMGVSESSSTKESGVSNLPDHLILNFPLDSPSFLNSLRWWPSGETIDSPPRVHVYTFARGDDVRTAAEVAIDMVADGLLPEGGYVEPSIFRGQYLNEELECDIQAREIRDAAPGKLVICVSFSATRLLLRRMQGDFGLD